MVRLTKKVRELKERSRIKAIRRQQLRREAHEAFQYKGKKTDLIIWLDVDRTLVDTYTVTETSWDGLRIVPRPDLRDFIRFCKSIAKEVNAISAAEKKPTDIKLDTCNIKLKHVLGYESMKKIPTEFPYPGYNYNYGTKLTCLKQVPGFDERTTLIIDDKPEYYPDAVMGNVIQVREFKAGEEDEMFLELARHIKNIALDSQRNIPEYIDSVMSEDPYYFPVKFVRPCEGPKGSS